MIDISLSLDGLIAYIVASLLALGLFVAIVTVFLLARKDRSTPIRQRPVFLLLIGMTLSVLLNIAVMGIVATYDTRYDIQGVNKWFDTYIYLWVPAALAPWLFCLLLSKRPKSTRIPATSVPTGTLSDKRA